MGCGGKALGFHLLHGLRTFHPASMSTGAELRHLEKAIFSKGGFSLKAQPGQGRAHPSPCQEGSRLLHEGLGWLPRGLFLAAAGIPPARHLVLRDKAIQYLQEHIWQRGSTINLPHFNTPCPRLAIAASSQPGSEQLLEAAVPPLSPLSLLSQGPGHHTACLGPQDPLSLGGQDFGPSSVCLSFFFSPSSSFIFS